MNKTFFLSLLVLCFGVTSLCADDWTRVTDPSVLSAGDRVIIACPAKGVAAGDVDVSKKIMTSVAATFSEDETIMTSVGSALMLTIGGEKGAWTLSDASGRFLGTSGVKDLGWNNYVHTWSITIEDGLATIQSTSATYGRLLYNVNAPRFTTYTSKTSSIMLLPTLYYKHFEPHTFAYDGYPEKTTRCLNITYSEGAQITLSNGHPTREGYIFTGWLYNGKIYQPGDIFVMPDADVALVPQWKADPSTALKDSPIRHAASKLLKDNTLYIIVGDETYDILGNKR